MSVIIKSTAASTASGIVDTLRKPSPTKPREGMERGSADDPTMTVDTRGNVYGFMSPQMAQAFGSEPILTVPHGETVILPQGQTPTSHSETKDIWNKFTRDEIALLKKPGQWDMMFRNGDEPKEYDHLVISFSNNDEDTKNLTPEQKKHIMAISYEVMRHNPYLYALKYGDQYSDEQRTNAKGEPDIYTDKSQAEYFVKDASKYMKGAVEGERMIFATPIHNDTEHGYHIHLYVHRIAVDDSEKLGIKYASPLIDLVKKATASVIVSEINRRIKADLNLDIKIENYLSANQVVKDKQGQSKTLSNDSVADVDRIKQELGVERDISKVEPAKSHNIDELTILVNRIDEQVKAKALEKQNYEDLAKKAELDIIKHTEDLALVQKAVQAIRQNEQLLETVDALTSEVDDKTATIDGQQKVIEDIEGINKAQAETIVGLTDNVKNLAETVDALTSEVADKTATIDEQHKLIENIEGINKAQGETIVGLTDNVKNLAETVDVLTGEKATLQETITVLDKEKAQATIDINKLTTDKAALETTVVAQQTAIAEKDKEIADNNQAIAKLTASNTNIGIENEKLTRENAGLTAELTELRNANDTLTRERDSERQAHAQTKASVVEQIAEATEKAVADAKAIWKEQVEIPLLKRVDELHTQVTEYKSLWESVTSKFDAYKNKAEAQIEKMTDQVMKAGEMIADYVGLKQKVPELEQTVVKERERITKINDKLAKEQSLTSHLRNRSFATDDNVEQLIEQRREAGFITLPRDILLDNDSDFESVPPDSWNSGMRTLATQYTERLKKSNPDTVVTIEGDVKKAIKDMTVDEVGTYANRLYRQAMLGSPTSSYVSTIRANAFDVFALDERTASDLIEQSKTQPKAPTQPQQPTTPTKGGGRIR